MTRKCRVRGWRCLPAIFLFLLFHATCDAQTTQFTYQGKLTDGGGPANGNYDFHFELFDAAASGNQLGGTMTRTNVAVAGGVFTVALDFAPCANCFSGGDRFLEVAVKPAGAQSYTTLTPRQPVTSNPYALRSLNAAQADGLSAACVSCIVSAQIGSVNASAVTGELPAQSIPPGNTNYIQNSATQQTSANFNISGNGAIGGTLGIGTATPAGVLHARGVSPVRILGDPTTLAGSESVDFFARSSTFSSDLGGMRIQRQGGSGDIDTSLWAAAVGNPASEKMRVLGNGKVGIGTASPTAALEVSGTGGVKITSAPATLALNDSNSHIQSFLTQSGNGDLSFFAGTLLGGASLVMKGNAGNVGIGTSAPEAKLHVEGGSGTGVTAVTARVSGSFSTGLRGESDAGSGVEGTSTSFSGVRGSSTDGIGVAGNSVSSFGVSGSSSNGDGVNGFSSGGNGVKGTSASHFGIAGYTTNGTGVYGDNNNSNSNGHAGYFNGRVGITGNLTVNGQLFNPSDVRLKQQIRPLEYGLAELLRLRPVTWKWNTQPDGPRQMGMVAQDVEAIVPELVYHDADPNQPLAMNYIGLVPIMVRAVQDQQQQITQQQQRIVRQQEMLEKQQRQIEALRVLLCADRPSSSACNP